MRPGSLFKWGLVAFLEHSQSQLIPRTLTHHWSILPSFTLGSQALENASRPGPSSRGISAWPHLGICPIFCLLIANLPIFYCLLLSASDLPLHPLNTEQWLAGKPRSLVLAIAHNKPLQSYWCRPAIVICEWGSQQGHRKCEWLLVVWVTLMTVTKCPIIKPSGKTGVFWFVVRGYRPPCRGW